MTTHLMPTATGWSRRWRTVRRCEAPALAGRPAPGPGTARATGRPAPGARRPVGARPSIGARP
ncbi:hypothetical protein [Kitasatospora terrestris]|uniref:hypothetical protein n=1 Tax=Kitasatospora terrestris TaxID=258051 RepID=UPI0031E81238